MIKPAKADPSMPRVSWAGQKWPVPELAPIHLDQVWDDIKAINPRLFTKDDPQDDGEPLTDDQRRARDFSRLIGRVYDFTGEEFKRMRHVVYVGLTALHPDLDEADYNKVPVTPADTMLAFLIVRSQSLMYGWPGMKVRRDASSGEATAAGAQNGNSSSPAPAATSETPENIGGGI